MKKALLLSRRNALEMLRDPVLYIFCLGFPVLMLGLFQIIDRYTDGMTPVFLPRSLVPGVMVFSFTFLSLTICLLVSRDKSTALLRRLYTAPLRSYQFVLGYAIPALAVGIAQAFLCVGAGLLLSVLCGTAPFSLGEGCLLILTQLPILCFCVFLGILLGTLFNDKSGPGVCSILISASGILGGAWMPLDTMGAFEDFCRWLPFYPSVVFGRIVTGAQHSVLTPTAEAAAYTLDRAALLGLIPISISLAAAVSLSFLVFHSRMSQDV